MKNRPIFSKKSVFNSLTFTGILLLSILVFFWPDSFWPEISASLEFNRSGVQNYELYRLITSSFVHNNIHHLWLNVLGGVLLMLLFNEHFTLINQVVVFLCCSLAVGVGVYFFSSYSIYMGLSGYLHGVFAWAVFRELTQRRKSAWLLAIGGILKLVYEQIVPPAPAEDSLIAIDVATDAHLYGAIGGLILSVCYTLYQITKKQSD